MTAKKAEVDPALAEATKARDDAVKARAKAKHSAATVLIATQALATAHEVAAAHHLEAEEAEKVALDHAVLARKALEESLGIVHEDTPKKPAIEAPKPEAVPPTPH